MYQNFKFFSLWHSIIFNRHKFNADIFYTTQLSINFKWKIEIVDRLEKFKIQNLFIYLKFEWVDHSQRKEYIINWSIQVLFTDQNICVVSFQFLAIRGEKKQARNFQFCNLYLENFRCNNLQTFRLIWELFWFEN